MIPVIIYTILTQVILNQLNKNEIKLGDFYLRIWNEGATLLLISIISLAIIKTSVSWINAILIFIVTTLVLLILIRAYKLIKKD